MTDQQKKDFCAYLRTGKTAPEAAALVHPEFTASMFKRYTNEQSRDYDPFFAAEYIRAKAEGRKLRHEDRSASAQPRVTTLSGHVKADYITDEMLDQFVEYVEAGVPSHDAALLLEPKTSITQINRRAAKDEEFAQRYADAKHKGYPAFQEGLRATIARMAEQGDYRAARDLAIIHLPEFRDAFLTKKTEILGGTSNELRVLVSQVFPELPDAELNRLIQTVEQRQIGPGDDVVIDAA